MLVFQLFGPKVSFCFFQQVTEKTDCFAIYEGGTVRFTQASSLPNWMMNALKKPGLSIHNQVSSTALNLDDSHHFATVVGLTIPLQKNARCWVGTSLEDGETVDVDALTLFAQSLGLVLERNLLATKRRTIELQYRTLVEQMPGAIYYRELDKPGTTNFIAPQIEAITGITPEQLTSGEYSFYDLLHPEDKPRVLEAQKKFNPEDSYKSEAIMYRMIRPDKRVVWIENVALILRNEHGKAESILGILYDATEKKELEEQLRQSQKLEAIGQLAGGIAHDFNNLLAVILGFGGMLIEDMDSDNPYLEDVTAMVSAGERGANLVKQLLTFSRKEVIHPELLRVDRVVKEMQSMVSRLLNAQVAFSLKSGNDLGQVFIDRGQLEQVVMNLVLNARDAMPTGGHLKVHIDNVRLDEVAVATMPDVTAGEYVMLSVSDTGTGMSNETKQRIFEPFYTTKRVGEGTGLGLSTVMGIVRQNNGSILVYTELGHGTTIKVYLPKMTNADGSNALTTTEQNTIVGGSEHILLVEDDGHLKGLLTKLLKKLGYQVTTADDGEMALKVYREAGPFDLLITDIIMPKSTGPALVETLRKLNPELSVVFMSGYTGDVLQNHNIHIHETSFLHKPFTVPDLSVAVRAALDNPIA